MKRLKFEKNLKPGHKLNIFGRYLEDIIYGATDGIVTTFVIMAGAIGAGFSNFVVIILGLANLIADGFSMAASDFLATKSEIDLYSSEYDRENKEVAEVPETEKSEVRDILIKNYNYSEEESGQLVDTISRNKKFWIDLMMTEELGLAKPSTFAPWSKATATFFSFILIGAVPLIPYIFLEALGDIFFWAIIASSAALFIVGALRSLIIKKHWIVAGVEMLIVGAVSSLVAYLIGHGLAQMFI